MSKTIIEFQEDMLVDDLKSSIGCTEILCSDKLRKQIEKLDNHLLVNVKQKMVPAIKIMKVIPITEKNVLEV